jgi:hypothetical protein
MIHFCTQFPPVLIKTTGALYLPHIASKIHIVAMLTIVGIQTIFQTKFVGMFIICLDMKFHIPSSNGV